MVLNPAGSSSKSCGVSSTDVVPTERARRREMIEGSEEMRQYHAEFREATESAIAAKDKLDAAIYAAEASAAAASSLSEQVK